MFFGLLLLTCLLFSIVITRNCFDSNFKFYKWKSLQRSLSERLFVDNVDSLEACEELARKYRGLAFNYSFKERLKRQREEPNVLRDHFWNQPHLYFNCHILRCPENGSFKTMVNDSSFDYFSLYEKPMANSEYICVPEIGLFALHTIPDTFTNASKNCRHNQNFCGRLAHVASQKRTEALSRLIISYNEQHVLQFEPKIYLVYVGLLYNSTWSNNMEFFNDEQNNLKCFDYRAWEPGNPKISSELSNASCVALTVKRTWKTVKCDRKLPYICEIWTSCGNEEETTFLNK